MGGRYHCATHGAWRPCTLFTIVPSMPHEDRYPCTIHALWIFGHKPWVVQQLSRYTISMTHGLYNGTHLPWCMDCTRILSLHGAWIVQWWTRYIISMHHGLYKGTYLPWCMDCTTVDKVYHFHAPWIVQQQIRYMVSMHHGLYKGTYLPW